MKRLTKRDKLGYAFIEKKKIEDYVVNGVRICASDAIDKLAKLEDLEDKYRIELTYLFKLMDEGADFCPYELEMTSTGRVIRKTRRVLAIIDLEDEAKYLKKLNQIEELRRKGDK